jgi:hypothetical protein
MRLGSLPLALFCLPAGACALAKEVTEFPPGLEPLEDNRAPWPEERGDDTPESLGEASGEGFDEDLEADYSWCHARGYVKKPLRKVYSAIRVPRVGVDRRQVHEFDVEWGVEPEYTHSYVIHNTVNDIITVEYDITWRHGAVEGTESEPLGVGSRWQKTEGSTVIEMIRGSVYSFEVDESTTALEMVLHQRSLRVSLDPELCRTYLQDFFVDILAESHGEPLPAYPTGS